MQGAGWDHNGHVFFEEGYLLNMVMGCRYCDTTAYAFMVRPCTRLYDRLDEYETWMRDHENEEIFNSYMERFHQVVKGSEVASERKTKEQGLWVNPGI